MKLSDLKVGQTAKWASRMVGQGEFLVIECIPEGRFTKIYKMNGEVKEFLWDHFNPEVIPTGYGKLETKFVRIEEFK